MENIILLNELQAQIVSMESNLSNLIKSKVNELSISTSNVSTQLSDIDTKYNNIYIRDFSNVYITAVTNITNFNNVNSNAKHWMVSSKSNTDWLYFINRTDTIYTHDNYYTNVCTNFISQMEGTFSIYWTTHSWRSNPELINASYFHIIKNDNIITNVPLSSNMSNINTDQPVSKYIKENLSTNVGDNWKIIYYLRPEGSSSIRSGLFSTIFNNFHMVYTYSNIVQPKSINIISSI